MPQLAYRTAVEEYDAGADRSTPGMLSGVADRFRDVESTFRLGGSADRSSPQANAPSGQLLTSGEQNVGAGVLDPAPTPVRPPASASFHALQEWEGHVLAVGRIEFVARLVDLTAGGSLDGEEAVIPRDELSETEEEKLNVGGIFRWVIGYERSPAGTKRRVSHIVFRELPVITDSDLQEGEAWASEMARSLNP